MSNRINHHWLLRSQHPIHQQLKSHHRRLNPHQRHRQEEEEEGELKLLQLRPPQEEPDQTQQRVRLREEIVQAVRLPETLSMAMAIRKTTSSFKI